MIKDGDLFVSFRLSAPERGDLVVYRHGGVLSVGRVFALGGEHVEITPAAVLCDSFRQPDSAGYDAGLSRDFECRVPEGCVFVLNDNRADLSDSRTWESIPLTDCEGPVVFLMRRRGF